MGQCGVVQLPQVVGCDGKLVEGRFLPPPEDFCMSTRTAAERVQDQKHHCSDRVRSPLSHKGLSIWADSLDALLRELPCELDADMDHMHLLPARNPSAGSSSPGFFEMPFFPRDVSVRCLGGGDDSQPNQDNYALVQLDDLASPWGLYAVADGHGPQGHLVSTLLVYELPGLLVQNPCLHCDSDLALYQSFLSAGEMAASCQMMDASFSGGTLSAALLRDGVLHVAWVGDSKVVLGRLASPPAAAPPTSGAAAAAGADGAAGGAACPAAVVACPLTEVGDRPSCPSSFPLGPPPAPELRAVELTADHISQDAGARPLARGAATAGAVDAADGAGGPALAGPPRGLARFFGYSALLEKQRTGGSADGRGSSRPCTPEVRRLHIRQEDLFVILGTRGLWKALSPAEAVAVVGRCLHRTAEGAAEELVAEVQRRQGSRTPPDDLTAVVLYLAGERCVKESVLGRGDSGMQVLLEARDHIAGCCVPESTGLPQHSGKG